MKMKIMILLSFVFVNMVAFGEIFFKVTEPLKFTPVNSTHVEKGKILGIGTIEVSTDNKKVDFGKKIVFNFPEYIYLSNGRKWIKTDEIGISTDYKNKSENRELIISKETEQVKFYGVIDKNQMLGDGKAEEIDGEYVGDVQIVISQYVKEVKNVW